MVDCDEESQSDLKCFIRPKKVNVQQILQRNANTRQECSFVIIKHVQELDQELPDFIFSEKRFIDEIKSAIIALLQTKSGYRSIDHEIVQTLTSNINKIFENYNKEFAIFGLALSKNMKSLAHLITFKELFMKHLCENEQKVDTQLNIWREKKNNLCKFFVSQVSPAENKDEENSRHFLTKFTEEVTKISTAKAKTFIEERVASEESDFSRIKLLMSCDKTLTTLDNRALREYVLDPTQFFDGQFDIIWNDFENGMNKEIERIKQKHADLYDELKGIIGMVSKLVARSLNSAQDYKAQEIFRLIGDFDKTTLTTDLNNNKDVEINEITHLKGNFFF